MSESADRKALRALVEAMNTERDVYERAPRLPGPLREDAVYWARHRVEDAHAAASFILANPEDNDVEGIKEAAARVCDEFAAQAFYAEAERTAKALATQIRALLATSTTPSSSPVSDRPHTRCGKQYPKGQANEVCRRPQKHWGPHQCGRLIWEDRTKPA